MLAIKNCELVLHDHYLPDAVLFIENGKISDFGEMSKMTIPENCELIDAEGLYLAPGLIDIHVHNGDKAKFIDSPNVQIGAPYDPVYAAKYHLSHGVTTVLPTFAYKYSLDEIIEGFNAIRELMKTHDGVNIGGVYMEGPYTSAKFGSNKKLITWQNGVIEEEYKPMVDAAGDLVKNWTVAPEREGIEEFVKYAKKVNPDVRFSVGHSEALPWQIEKLMKYGLCIGTHHTNATGTIINYPECRGVCVDEAVNYNKDIYAELICDSHGIHVHPYMLRLIRQIKGDDRIILVSDQSYNNGPIPEGYDGVTDLFFDCEGEISGSKLTLDCACRNMMKHTGASLVQVCNFASYNPAEALGFTDRGSIEVGKRADLIIVDHKFNVKSVFVNGIKER